MFRTKQSRTEAAVDQARSTATDLGSAASDRLGSLRESAADSAGDAAAIAKDRAYAAKAAAAPAIQDAADAARERFYDAAATAKDVAGDALHEAADRAKPKVEAAQSTLVDTVLPKVGAAIATAAAALAAGAEQAREAAQPHLEQAAAQAKETAAVGGHRAHDAYAVLKGDAVAKKRGGKGKWLIAIGLTAAGVAAVAAFRKQKQADDPWATPLDSRAAAGGAVGSEPATFKDKAAETVGHAKEAVADAATKAKEKGSELADAAKDKAGDLASKGQSAIADAKDRSGEAVDDATDVLPTDDTSAPPAGEVTAVDAAPDSDAITSEAVEGGTINGASKKSSPRGSAKAKLAEENGDSKS